MDGEHFIRFCEENAIFKFVQLSVDVAEDMLNRELTYNLLVFSINLLLFYHNAVL